MLPRNAINRFLLRASVLLATGGMLAPLACRRSSFPNEATFRDPPYRRIFDGLKADVDPLPENLPVLQAGQKVAFYARADGTIGTFECDERIEVEVGSPRHSLAVSRFEAGGSVSVHEDSRSVRQAEKAGAVQTATVDRSVASSQGASGMESRTASRTGEQSVGTGGHTTQVREGQVRQSQAAGGHSTQVGSAETRHSQDQGDLATVSGSGQMAAERTASGDQRTAEGSLATMHAHSRGGFARLTGQDLVKLLTESDLAVGFYGLDETRIEYGQDTVVAMAEREEFIRLLQERGSLEALLNRPVSGGLRETATVGDPPRYAGVVELDHVPSPVLYGHEFAMVISVKNTGNSSLLDVLVLNELPANTQFVRFTVSPSSSRGFFPAFVESDGQKLLAVKLYQPLEPGATFRLPVILRAAPWPIRKADR
jgi:uncharacterized repeat protein (TIGR01451 family)